MKLFPVLFLAIALSLNALADTPPPGAVVIKDASGNKVTTTTESGQVGLNAYIINPGGASTVLANQGAPNTPNNAWPFYLCNAAGTNCLAVNSDGSINITGSITVSNFPSNQNVTVTNGSIPVTGTFWQTTQPISGTVAVSNFPSTYPVTGTFWQATQPVSGSLGRTWSLLNTTDSVNVGNFPSTYPVTGTFWQATQPISVASLPLPSNAAQESGGHLASIDSKLTDTANGLKVDGSAVTQPVSAASLPLPSGASTSANQTNGSQKTQMVDGSGTVQGPMQTLSGTNYAPVVLASSATNGSAVPARSVMVSGTDGTNARTVSTDTSGNQNVNVVNTPTVTANAGTNLNTSSLALSATQTNGNQKTQVVDGAGHVQPAGDTVARGINIIPSDGTNSVTVKPASTASTATDTSLVVALSPESALPTGTNNMGNVGLETQSSASSTTVGSVSLGQSTGKVAKMETGNLQTTAVTANQTILTYTVTAGKTFYLQYFDCTAGTNTAAATAELFGTCSLSINGTVVYQQNLKGSGVSNSATVYLAEPIPIAAGQVILWETTPFATTAFNWYANFGGYEK